METNFSPGSEGKPLPHLACGHRDTMSLDLGSVRGSSWDYRKIYAVILAEQMRATQEHLYEAV